jgi:hypothetical protein
MLILCFPKLEFDDGSRFQKSKISKNLLKLRTILIAYQYAQTIFARVLISRAQGFLFALTRPPTIIALRL